MCYYWRTILLNNKNIKELVERYPFLLPRDIFTDQLPEGYDYSYIKYLEIPDGWYKLFFQMCEDIRQPLIDAGWLDKFRFTQVKEKYNEMRCYCTGAPKEVDDILEKYEQMSYYVCTECGAKAKYETTDYLASFCRTCKRGRVRNYPMRRIRFKTYYHKVTFENGRKTRTRVSFKDEWKRYKKSLKNT